MLSKETFDLLRKSTEMMFYVGAAPFVWRKNNSGVNTLYLKESRRYRSFTASLCAVLIFYNSFLTKRLGVIILEHQHNLSSQTSLVVILQILWNFLSYSLPLLMMGNNFLYWKEIPFFINGYLVYFEHFKEKFVRKNNPKWKNGCERKLKIMVILGMLIFIQNAVLLIKKPERAYFLTSLLSDPMKAPLVKKIPLMLAQMWVWFSLWSHIYYYCFTLMGYAYAIVYLLSQLKRNFKTCDTIEQMREPRNFIKMYRELQVLHNMFNFCFQSFFIPIHKLILVDISVIGIYGGIRIPGPRAIIMCLAALMGLMYLSLLFRRMGKLYEKSLDVLHSWKYERRKYIRKFVRSCQPIKVEIGVYYYVTKTTVIVIWATVFNFTTNMLLSF